MFNEKIENLIVKTNYKSNTMLEKLEDQTLTTLIFIAALCVLAQIVKFSIRISRGKYR
jgi:hypothetical protein